MSRSNRQTLDDEVRVGYSESCSPNFATAQIQWLDVLQHLPVLELDISMLAVMGFGGEVPASEWYFTLSSK